MSAGLEVTFEDCCLSEPGKPARLIKNGIRCATAKLGFEAGVGIGGDFAFGGAVAKLIAAGGEASCSRCNKCGETTPNVKCCLTAKVTIGSVSGNLGFIQAEFSLLSFERTFCYGADGYTSNGTTNGPQGKGGLGASGTPPDTTGSSGGPQSPSRQRGGPGRR